MTWLWCSLCRARERWCSTATQSHPSHRFAYYYYYYYYYHYHYYYYYYSPQCHSRR
jgi:hypothetical protein